MINSQRASINTTGTLNPFQGTPTPCKEPPIYRNSHIVLVRINPKLALYQPQSPFKGALCINIHIYIYTRAPL